MTAAIDTIPKLHSRRDGAAASLGQMPWALADQMLISATNFFTLILLARGFTQSALGQFTIVYSILLFFNSIQTGMVTQPHNIIGVTRHGRDYQLYTSSTAASQLILLAFASGLILIALFVSAIAGWTISPLLAALIPALISVQLLELTRRVLYTEGRVPAATAIDAITCASQCLGLAWLWKFNLLTGPNVLHCISATSFIGAAIGLLKIRRVIIGRVSLAAIQENWNFGKWSVCGEIAGNWLSVQLFIYLSAGILGASAAGILRAMHTIFGPTRILADMMCTMLPIHFSRILAARGKSVFHSHLVLCHVIAIPVLGGYCLLVSVFAAPILGLLYGDRYSGHAPVLALYAMAAFASYMMMIVAAALRTRRLTRQLFFNQLLASLIAVPLGWLLIARFGVPGTALAMVVTYALTMVLFWRTYRRSRHDASDREILEFLHESARSASVSSNHHASAPLFCRVFELFDRFNIPYCITHGHQSYPDRIGSDVDLVMPASVVKNKLAALFHDNQAFIEAKVVQWIHADTHYIVLMGMCDGQVEHLCLDISLDYELAGRVFLSGNQILAGRQRHGGFWIAAPDVEFTCILIRRIIKNNLHPFHALRLAELYRADPGACAWRISTFFSERQCRLLERAAYTGDWKHVRSLLPRLRSSLLYRAVVRRPVSFVMRKIVLNARRLMRWCRRDHGFHVILLGPDGAGKSSLARTLRAGLGPAFFNASTRSFPPALLDTGDASLSDCPHQAPPRSAAASVLRAVCYWMVYNTLGHLFTLFAERARVGFSIHDRHFVDTLVDPRRYRYAGPHWLLRAIWRATPRPDLVLVLDAPPQVIQSHKREVPFEETARQCGAYRALAAELPMARILRADQPIETVAADAFQIIVSHLAARVRHRFPPAACRHTEPVREALCAGFSIAESDPVFINKIGAGDQADVYEGFTASDSPGRLSDQSLIVKIFKPDRPDVELALAEEYECLGQLNTLLDDLQIDGWHIRVPKPIAMNPANLTILMSKIPGRPLNQFLEQTSRFPQSHLSEIAHALVGALERFWTSGRNIYGDFNLNNVLCDAARRQLSLVDPGMPETSYLCLDVARRWYPASRDMAYLLFDAATSIRAGLFRPVLRNRQRDLVMEMFQLILRRIPTADSKLSFLNEVGACARTHLRRIRFSWSAAGLRRLMVRSVAAVRMNQLLQRLELTSARSAPAPAPLWSDELKCEPSHE